MPIRSDQVIRYLATLSEYGSEPAADLWSVAEQRSDLVWAGWRPDSVVSPGSDSPAEPASTPRFDPLTIALDKAPAPRVRTLLDRLVANADEEPIVPKAVRERREAQGLAHSTAPAPAGLPMNALAELAARDRLHFEQILGRVGWLFVAGSIAVADSTVTGCFPLFERSVSFVHRGDEIVPQWKSALRRSWMIKRRGDARETDPIDEFLAAGAGAIHRDRLATDVAAFLQPFGIDVVQVADADTHPFDLRTAPATALIPGCGFYLAAPQSRPSQSSDVQRWATRTVADTAVAALYQTVDRPELSAFFAHPAEPAALPPGGRVRSSLPLNERQRQAVRRARTEPVVTVSGPPGTGKTHTIVAAAADAVARGESVLIATKSDVAAESADELLSSFPTPPHVRFGRPEHRRQVADLLSGGSSVTISDAELRELIEAEDRAWADLEAQWSQILQALDRKARFERARSSPDLLAAAGAPAVAQPDFDFAELDRLLHEVERGPGTSQHRRALKRLTKLVGASSTLTPNDLVRAIAGARAERALNDGVEAGLGTGLDDLWLRLDRLERDARATSAVVDIARRSHQRTSSPASVAALATELRNALEQDVSDRPIQATSAFLDHVPFWVGTLEEIGSLLPMNPAMFDLVIFDEANQIDQMEAVAGLARAKRVMIVGDPKQLRHDTSVAADARVGALVTCDIAAGTPDATILDVRANSLFDVAASASPVTTLDEHYRSIPHLIEFSSHRWYSGSLRLMTQHPRNENRDAIHAHRLHGSLVDGVNVAEVAAVIDFLALRVATGRNESIAVIAPIEAHARAIEHAAVDRFGLDIVRRHQLRIGTVPEMQGMERHATVISPAITEPNFDQYLPVLQDPHLFNVLITRARQRIDVFHSFDPTRLPAGLLADWFRWEQHPPGSPDAGDATGHRSRAGVSRWTQELVDALELGSARVRVNYPVAGWLVDLVVGEGHAALGVETTVHPDGPEAHGERHLTLKRAGWDLMSVFENNWFLGPQDAAVHIAAAAARRAEPT